MWGYIKRIVCSILAKMQGRKDDLQSSKTGIFGCLKGTHCRRKGNYLELSQDVQLESAEGIK